MRWEVGPFCWDCIFAVRGPMGTAKAQCTNKYSPKTWVGEFEPVCDRFTKPKFQECDEEGEP